MELSQIKGIGPKTIELLKNMQINTVEDLLTYYPYRYNDYEMKQLDEVTEGEIVTVKAMVETIPTVNYIKRMLNTLRFSANISNYSTKVVIFNRAFLKQHITIGKELILIGKYNKKNNTFTANDIKFKEGNGIEPVYHSNKNLKNKDLIKLVEKALPYTKYVVSKIPATYEDKYHLVNQTDALKMIHVPKSMSEARHVQSRFIYEELFIYMFKVLYNKRNQEKVVGIAKKIDQHGVEKFLQSLPFQLTSDQHKTVQEALNDLSTTKRMNRLILGDVGSGKTIVATTIMYANCLSGFQSALMAPTEILATQHYLSIKKLLEPFNITVGLLTGSMKEKEKKTIYQQLENQEIDTIIGTHALLNDKVNFKNLGLVVTDEQHRFGVNQRRAIEEKGNLTDILYLSATPIPRTYALTIYGDMDTSFIKTKPSGRKKIITQARKESDLKIVLQNVLEQIKEGHQIYVVAPLIEDDEENELDLNDVYILKEKFDRAFNGKVPISILHGKMKPAEKDSIMNDFKDNKTKILISTTVIEVGVDVKNATTMVIFNAERFGLATLHQLRGRIGRNELQCYCFLVSNQDTKRLSVMESSDDGFYISEQDFQIRGQGDLFGTSQSGGISFKIADLKRDYHILLQAKKDVEEFISTNEYQNYPYYQNICQEIEFIT